jgi:hypothetical protein
VLIAFALQPHPRGEALGWGGSAFPHQKKECARVLGTREASDDNLRVLRADRQSLLCGPGGTWSNKKALRDQVFRGESV